MPETNTMNPSPAIVETLSRALRNDRFQSFNEASPLASCLLPLLQELGCITMHEN